MRAVFLRPPVKHARRGFDKHPLNHIQVHIVVDCHLLEPDTVKRNVENGLLRIRREVPFQVGFEFLNQQGQALFAPTTMPNGVFDRFFKHCSILQLDAQSIGDRSFFGVVVVRRITRLFDAFNFRSQLVNTRIGGNVILVVSRGESAKKQRNRDHVLDAMVAISRVSQRSFLVDDSQAGFMSSDRDPSNVRSGLPQTNKMESDRQGRFNGGLRVKFRRVADFEKHIFHYIGAVGPLKTKGISAK